MHEMQITPADRTAGHLKDDIARLDDSGLRCVDCSCVSTVPQGAASCCVRAAIVLTDLHVVLAHPDQSLHGLSAGVGVLCTVASWIAHVLLCGRHILMTYGFLHIVCCLRHGHLD